MTDKWAKAKPRITHWVGRLEAGIDGAAGVPMTDRFKLAIEAAAKELSEAVSDLCDEIYPRAPCTPEQRRIAAEKFASIIAKHLPLPDDTPAGEVVERETMKMALTVLCAARGGQSWGYAMTKDFDLAIEGIRSALAGDETRDIVRMLAPTRIGKTLHFFASVIKSGEPWSDACEAARADANEAINALAASPAPVGETCHDCGEREPCDYDCPNSLESAPVAGEWKLVPVEPTEEMIDAGNEARTSVRADTNTEDTWSAMLEMAPEPPLHPAAAPPASDALVEALEKIAGEQKVYKGHGDYDIIPAFDADEAQRIARTALASKAGGNWPIDDEDKFQRAFNELAGTPYNRVPTSPEQTADDAAGPLIERVLAAVRRASDEFAEDGNESMCITMNGAARELTTLKRELQSLASAPWMEKLADDILQRFGIFIPNTAAGGMLSGKEIAAELVRRISRHAPLDDHRARQALMKIANLSQEYASEFNEKKIGLGAYEACAEIFEIASDEISSPNKSKRNK